MMLVSGLSRSLFILTTLTLAACGEGLPEDAGPPDADQPRDAGSATHPDATPVHDGGLDPDADIPGDAGRPDAAAIEDAGPDGGVDEHPPVRSEQAGGRTVSVALDDGLAYVGVGPRLTIWDTTAGPTRLGESAPLSGLVTAIEVADHRAYVGTVDPADSHLHVIDTSTIAQPVEVAVLRLGTGSYSQIRDIELGDAHLYVADLEQGIFVMDLRDPNRPVQVAFIAQSGVIELREYGSRLFAVAAFFNGDRVVHAFDTGTFESLGSVVVGPVQTELLAGGLLLTRGQSANIEDLDAFPTIRRLYTGPAQFVPASAADETGVWLSVNGQLRRLDLSDPSAITASPLYGADIWALTAGAASNGRLAFVDHQGGLEVFDITAGATSLGETQTGPCAYCYAAASWGDRLVLSETTPGAVGTVSTAQADDLSLVGRQLELHADFEDLVVVEDRAYVADWFTGLWAYDLSDPANPTPIATVPTLGYPSSIAIAGAYLVVGESSGGGALRVFDRGGDRGPTELGSIPTAFVRDLDAVGTVVFVAATSLGLPGGLYVYDVADPARIQLLAHYDACEAALGVAVDGARAVVGCEDAVHVLDVSTPAAPTFLSRWIPSGERKGGPVALGGDRFYVALEDGVSVVDLTDPRAPQRVMVHPTAWLARRLMVGRGRVVASAAEAGVYQWPTGRRPQ